MTQRAIVIGAGLGGLATALRLQCAGFQCTVLEAGSSPGGKMNRLQKGGFTFDTGPSLITMPWVFEDLFQSAGSRLEDHAQLIPLDPIADYRFEDGTRFEYTSHLPAWLATLKRIAPRDTTGFFEFMSLGARLFSVSRETFFKQSPFERPVPPSWRTLADLPLRHGWGNYRNTVNHFFQSPHLRELYARYPTYVGSSPDHCPATLAVIPYVEFAFGGYAVKGGLYRIVEGIVALARVRGVELRLNSPVARIVTEKGKAKGVELESGERLAADVVIMNGDHAATPQLLGHPAPPLRHRSLSGFVMLFGLNRPLNVHQHTVCFTSAEMVYVNAPEGANTLFVMANAPPIGKQWDEAMTAAARARVFDSLRRAGFPDFTSDIAVSDIWTPARFEADYRMPSGSIYGTDSHGWRNAFLRPPNKNRAVQGLYHAGGSTHPGGGTPTVLMSAEITSRLIAQRHT